MPSGVVVVWTDVSKLFGRTRDEVLAEAEMPRKESYL
jgi:hypothetical protein